MVGEGNGGDPVFIRYNSLFRPELIFQTSPQISVEFERKRVAASPVEKNTEEALVFFDVTEDIRERLDRLLPEFRFRCPG